MADITTFNFKEFYEKQVEYYKHNIEFDTEQIAWETEQLERSRKEDRELVEYVWSKGPIEAIDVRIYGRNGKGRDGRGYKSNETKRYLASRKKWYQMRKRDLYNLQEYEEKLAQMN